MDSETEIEKTFTDLTMSIRPDMRLKMEEARKRLGHYGDAFKQKYKNLRLKRFAVVSLGFQRL